MIQVRARAFLCIFTTTKTFHLVLSIGILTRMSKTWLTSFPLISIPLISNISSPSDRSPLRSAAPPRTMRLIMTLSISLRTVAPCSQTHRGMTAWLCLFFTKQRECVPNDGQSIFSSCSSSWAAAMTLVTDGLWSSSLHVTAWSHQCFQQDRNFLSVEGRSHQRDVLGLLYAHYLDSLSSPLGQGLSLGRGWLGLHLLLCYAIVGQKQRLEDKRACFSTLKQRLSPSVEFLLCSCGLVSTWMCVSDSRLCSSSPSLLWLAWSRFLT